MPRSPKRRPQEYWILEVLQGVVKDRRAVDFDQRLRPHIREWTQARAKPGGKDHRLSRSNCSDGSKRLYFGCCDDAIGFRKDRRRFVSMTIPVRLSAVFFALYTAVRFGFGLGGA